MPTIGPTFASELIAQSIPLDGIAWSSTGAIIYAKTVDNGIKNQIAPILAAHKSSAELPVTIVTPRQIRLALNQIGLRSAVETYVAGATQDVKDSWAYSTEFDITNPLISTCMSALGKSESDLQALFNLAATL